ncbi:MAG: S8 family serine peptidase [Candidatus Krumholzibacteriia bacterium]
MTTRRLVSIACLAALLACGGGARAGIAPGHAYVPGEVIIKFRAGATTAQKSSLLGELRGKRLREFRGIRAEQRRLAGMTVAEAIARYADDPRVEYIEPNYVLTLDTTPDDPRFPDLWGLDNTGQTVPGGVAGAPGADIDAPGAWSVFTGSNDVVVCVIDTGVNYNHEDLAANAWVNPGEIAGNGIDDDGNGFIDDIHGWDFVNNDNDPMDDNGHGSHCSGTIGAVGNNGIGVTGVNWQVRIMAAKFLDAGGTGSTADAIACVEYATRMGADVLNNSWGGGPYDPAMADAIQFAYDAGIFFVAAAGNSGDDNDVTPHYPSNYTNPNVISVMATDQFDNPVNEPGWWATCYGDTTVDIAAPGLYVWSTVLGNDYASYSGTSMATPHVSGALALLRGRFPDITVDAGKRLLLGVGRDVLPSLAGRCVSGARLNLLKLISDPDTIPPGQVADLSVTEVASNWVQLGWTATGDDGGVGAASAYDLRRATAPIDGVSWETATPIVGEPVPQPAGGAETCRVTGLAFATTYYFAVKARDEYGNAGPLSNVATGTTLGAPVVAVAPAALSATLATGGSATQTLTISNVGEGVLDFTIPGAEYLLPAKTRRGPVPTYTCVELAKGVPDPRAGIAGAGGPDAFGYNWRDSDEPGGPTFNWIEIDTLGTAVTLTDDSNQGPFPLGFTFPFYGNDFTSFRICSNGWLSFTSTATSAANSGLPAGAAPGDLLALFWDDLDPSAGGHVYYYNDGKRMIVEYKGVPSYNSGGPYSLQAHIYPDGLVEYHYLTMTPPADSATIGIQNADGTDGLLVGFNTAYVHDNLAVRFYAIPPWLSVSPNGGSVAAGASVDLTVTCNATGLCGSRFDADLHVMSNDPVTPDRSVPVGLDLIGTPDILVAPGALDFGPVYLTATRELTVTVENGGCADLHVTGVAIDDGRFTTTVAVPFTLAPGAALAVPVVFAPTAAGPLAGTLSFTSDDPDSPAFPVALAGSGLEFPDIAVAPPSLAATLASGGTSTGTLTITNNGAGVLDFTIPEPVYRQAKRAAAKPQQYLELAKDAVDPRTGGPVATGSGGPDAFGYTWQDSDEPGGPAFDWIEIQGLGTALTLADDDNQGPFPLGFSLPFHGNTFTSFRVGSNGFVSFSSTSTALTNSGLPAAGAPSDLLALFWDDLDPTAGGWIGYYNDGSRLIIEYKDVPRYASGGPYSMQIHLYPGGRIEYHYLAMAGARLDEATIGLQNAAGTDGLQVAFNAAYVHDNLAIRFQAVPPWLSLTPVAGAVDPGRSADVTVTFAAAGLCGDAYAAAVHVRSNDPDSPDVVVPATLNLLGTPEAQVSATALDFGSVYLTQSAALPLTLADAGCATLNVTGLAIDNGAFTVDAVAPLGVPVGGGVVLNVSFAPTAAGPAAGILTITTDDPVRPELRMSLAGVGQDNVSVAVFPAELLQVVPFNGARTRAVTICNNGDGELAFTVPSPDISSKLATARPDAAGAWRDLAKDEADPRTSGPVATGAGGPDLFGYRWLDSDEPGGPAYAWVDIAATGTVAITSGDDVNAGPFPIGFTFSYHDGQFDTFRVCSNGFLSFTGTATAPANSGLPAAGAPPNLLAPFWDDLNVTGAARVYYRNVDGNLVVQWEQVPHYGTPLGGPYTFQIILAPNGAITYQYRTLGTARLNECTVGLQNATGTDGLQCVFNAAYLHDGLAIRFAALPRWLSATPTAGIIPAHASAEVTVTFDAAGLDYGLYAGQLQVASNDIRTPLVLVPVTMDVQNLTDVGEAPVVPTVQALAQNVPNPFNPQTTIEFSLPVRALADLRIYDLRGAVVRTLVVAELPAAVHRYVWDGRTDRGDQAASGVYFYRLRADGRQMVRRMTLIR